MIPHNYHTDLESFTDEELIQKAQTLLELELAKRLADLIDADETKEKFRNYEHELDRLERERDQAIERAEELQDQLSELKESTNA